MIKLGSVEAQIVADSMEQRTIILLQNNTYWHIVTLLYTSTNVVLGDRNGKRRLPTGQRGGKRVRREPARAPWLHPDAQAGVDQIIDTARLRHDQNVHLL